MRSWVSCEVQLFDDKWFESFSISINSHTDRGSHSFSAISNFYYEVKEDEKKTHHRRQYNGSNLAAAGNCLRPVWFNVNSTCMTGENNHRFFLIHELLCISERNRSWGVFSASLSNKTSYCGRPMEYRSSTSIQKREERLSAQSQQTQKA